MKILIDNGHGQNTPGKRSPDGRFLEYLFNRTIARQIVADLTDRGYDASILVPEETDIPLSERCRRANEIVSLEGKDNVIIIELKK
ncbi:MAG: N-acetylmuramoyl-L-alanine amidase [Candidatus Cryptobacteroides sp.]